MSWEDLRLEVSRLTARVRELRRDAVAAGERLTAHEERALRRELLDARAELVRCEVYGGDALAVTQADLDRDVWRLVRVAPDMRKRRLREGGAVIAMVYESASLRKRVIRYRGRNRGVKVEDL